MKEEDVIFGLEYIATSPPTKYTNFHPETVAIAKAALDLIVALKAKLAATVTTVYSDKMDGRLL